MFGAENLRFPAELVPDRQLHFPGVQISVLEVAIIVLSFALMAALLLVMRKTQLGRALRAIAESPKAAALLGIDVEGLFYLTSFTAAALGGVGGVLIALYSNAVFPLMGQPMLHKGIAVIILGGMGDIRGALVGGLFLGFAEVMAVAYIGSTMRDAVAFGLLFLVLLLRPQGFSARCSSARRERADDGVVRHLLVDLQQPGADDRHQRPAGALDLAHPLVRPAGDGQRGVHGHRRLHRVAADDERRRAVPGGARRRHRARRRWSRC